jgi:hypothetical protein
VSLTERRCFSSGEERMREREKERERRRETYDEIER